MSVRSLIADPEVRERLDAILPPISKPAPLLSVPPRTNRYGLVGTAFDYALRFELGRRNPHAVSRPWVAEGAVERLPVAAARVGCSEKDIKLLKMQAAGIIEAAHRFLESHVGATVWDASLLAIHAVLLAKLDNVCRAYQLDPALTEADPDDVRDVVELLAIVPYELLSDPKVMLMNPTFGAFSSVVGGADADLISGDLLVDIKTTKAADLKPDVIRQLLVYLILAQRAHAADNEVFPVVRRVGIYFSRHGHLWQMPTEQIIEHPRYHETADWLIHFAEENELAPELRELWALMQNDYGGAGPATAMRRRPAAKKKARKPRR